MDKIGRGLWFMLLILTGNILAYCDVSVNGLLEDEKTTTSGLIQPNVHLQEESIYICGHHKGHLIWCW